MAREVTFSTDKNHTKTYATKANLERAMPRPNGSVKAPATSST